MFSNHRKCDPQFVLYTIQTMCKPKNESILSDKYYQNLSIYLMKDGTIAVIKIYYRMCYPRVHLVLVPSW